MKAHALRKAANPYHIYCNCSKLGNPKLQSTPKKRIIDDGDDDTLKLQG